MGWASSAHSHKEAEVTETREDITPLFRPSPPCKTQRLRSAVFQKVSPVFRLQLLWEAEAGDTAGGEAGKGPSEVSTGRTSCKMCKSLRQRNRDPSRSPLQTRLPPRHFGGPLAAGDRDRPRAADTGGEERGRAGTPSLTRENSRSQFLFGVEGPSSNHNIVLPEYYVSFPKGATSILLFF